MKTLKTILMLFFLGNLFSCIALRQEIKKENILRIQDYFPLYIGDKRIYRIRFSKSPKVIHREIRIVRKDGEEFIDSDKQRYKFDAYGLRGGTRRYLLKYPLQVGTKWLSVTGITRVERYVIVETDRVLETPSGNYKNCIVVRSRDRKGQRGVLEAQFFFAPHVGLAKVVTAIESRGKRMVQWTLELVSYQAGVKSTKKRQGVPVKENVSK